MTLHLTPALEQKLQRFASQTERTPDELAQEAVDGYLSYLEVLAAEARDGEESAEREGWLTHDEVFERLNRRLKKTA